MTTRLMIDLYRLSFISSLNLLKLLANAQGYICQLRTKKIPCRRSLIKLIGRLQLALHGWSALQLVAHGLLRFTVDFLCGGMMLGSERPYY